MTTRPRTLTAALLAAVLLAGIPAAAGAAPMTAPAASFFPPASEVDAAAFLQSLNAERTSRGRAGLVTDPALATAAFRLVGPMARSGSLPDPVPRHGATGYVSDARWVLARHPAGTPRDVLTRMLGQDGGALLAGSWTHAGVAWAAGPDGHVHVVVLLAEYRFRDVGPSVPFHLEINALANRGVVTGYPGDTYQPGRNVSRQAMAAFLQRVTAPGRVGSCHPDDDALFADVLPGHPFCAEVRWLAESAVTDGYPDGTFQPSRDVSRQAMSAFLFRALNPGDADPVCTPGRARTFRDVPSTHPFCGPIEWLATTGITTGYPDGTFGPGRPVTRQAMAAFVDRAARI